MSGEVNPCSLNSECLDSKVFVGNIPVIVKQHVKLKRFFEKFGHVERAQIVFDRRTGQSKKIGFVTFSDVDAAQRAIHAPAEELLFCERILRVHAAEERRSTLTIRQALATTTPFTREDENAESPVDDTPIFTLNADCFMSIFSFLTIKERITCERVCKVWHDMFRLLWTYVRHLKLLDLGIKSFGGPTGDQIVEVVKRASPARLVSLDLSSCRQISDGLPKILANLVPNLRSLDLSHTLGVFTPMVAEILGHLPLEKLNMSQCFSVSEKFLEKLFKCCPTLLYLDISQTGITGDCFSHVSGLRTVNISHCDQIQENCLVSLLDGNQLTLESFTACDLECAATLLSSRKSFPALQKLVLSCSALSYDAECSEFDFSGVPNLVEFNISFNTRMSHKTNIKRLALQCPKLRVLRISSLPDTGDDAGITALLPELSSIMSLEELDISYNSVDSSNFKLIYELTSLKKLTMCGMWIQITLSDIVNLIEALRSLNYLDISGLNQLRGDSVLCIMEAAISWDISSRGSTLIIIAGGCGLMDLPSEGIAKAGVSLSSRNNCVEMHRPFPYYSAEHGDDFGVGCSDFEDYTDDYDEDALDFVDWDEILERSDSSS